MVVRAGPASAERRRLVADPEDAEPAGLALKPDGTRGAIPHDEPEHEGLVRVLRLDLEAPAQVDQHRAAIPRAHLRDVVDLVDAVVAAVADLDLGSYRARIEAGLQRGALLGDRAGGLVAVLCRSSDHILCSKGDEP